jgi:hypothetical protein
MRIILVVCIHFIDVSLIMVHKGNRKRNTNEGPDMQPSALAVWAMWKTSGSVIYAEALWRNTTERDKEAGTRDRMMRLLRLNTWVIFNKIPTAIYIQVIMVPRLPYFFFLSFFSVFLFLSPVPSFLVSLFIFLSLFLLLTLFFLSLRLPFFPVIFLF